MRKIREEKRQKLKAIVDVREKEAAETGKALAEAQRRVGEEAAELAQEKLEAEKAAAKLPPLKADVKSGNKWCSTGWIRLRNCRSSSPRRRHASKSSRRLRRSSR